MIARGPGLSTRALLCPSPPKGEAKLSVDAGIGFVFEGREGHAEEADAFGGGEKRLKQRLDDRFEHRARDDRGVDGSAPGDLLEVGVSRLQRYGSAPDR